MHELKGKGYDIRASINYDLLGATGFMCALSALRWLRPHGVCFMAPPCNTWIWMQGPWREQSIVTAVFRLCACVLLRRRISAEPQPRSRGSTGRSHVNPEGNLKRESVREANMMVAQGSAWLSGVATSV